ncbi:class E sortase [Streptomyces sp. NBC_00878]|uniref:class E sortase n=1 Tax=Streptomyces sp. NBC_00878 TaxID=2975854 RepID=UPI00225A3756|nr:class E sortase [Streptomyces sp. NBC_00878]MCX4907185.1 class E sortase [Streptomyces sp. NBC_00878]
MTSLDFAAPNDGLGALNGAARPNGAMRAAVDGLADPLSDPLPGQQQPAAPTPPAAPAAPEQEWYDPQAYAQDWSAGQTASSYAEPVRRAHAEPAHGYAEPQPQPQPQPQPSYAEPQQPLPYAEPQRSYEEQQPSYGAAPGVTPGVAPGAAPQTPYEPPPADDETVGLRIADVESITGTTRTAAATPGSAATPAGGVGGAGAPGGGRAARRKAARRHGHGHGRHSGAGGSGGAHEGQEGQESRDESGAPLSRMEARRAARARKPGAAVLASRAIGEVFITTGVLMLLFVTYQLWWTNVRAHAQAGNAASSLQDDWASGKGNPGTFEPGQGFALLHIPKLDVIVPIAEGTDKKRVLDRGMVGHYAEDGVKTAMPDAKTGNFGLAGHRNTHGEPFRYINRLKPGDPIVVETQDKYFVYKMASILPVTPPSNTSVLDAIPKAGGFTKAGRYITLTTCTPEFTSKYRMIVWGTMVEERPRDQGKPDELVS